MRWWPSSLRARLTLWYTVLLGMPLIAFAIIGYVVVARTLLERTDAFIGDALTAFSRELMAERRAASTAAQAIRTTVDEVRFRDLHIVIVDHSGQIVATTDISADDPAQSGASSAEVASRFVSLLATRDPARAFATTLSAGPSTYRVLSRPLAIRGEQFDLAAAYPESDLEAVLQRIRGIFLIAVPLLIACAAIGGYVLAKRSLAPVSSMAARATEISASTLHERLPVAGGDELVGLARVVNDLLDRLEASFAQQQRFMADASHELRTPTAILRAEADVTLAPAHRDEEEYRASMSVMRDAARRLTRIVDDLFLLARADAGHLVMRRDGLYLEDLVHDATRGVRQIADRRAVRVELQHIEEAPFEGDADLLGRLLLNLLDNAIKYSPEGGTVAVAMSREGGQYRISITDAGPGIPADVQDRVFDRFFRVDAARSRSDVSDTSGAGLGLAIARRIAEMHGGRLDLTASRPGRTEFVLTLPATSDHAAVTG
jgi:two-component system, OmpR family, sensor kinase